MTHSTTDRPLAPPIWFLALCTANGVVGLTLLTPALPLVKTELSISSDAVQQLLSLYLLALAAGQLFYGPISDRIGRRPVLLFGAALYTCAGIAASLSSDIGQLITLRFIQGLGAAACIAMGRSIVTDVFARDEAARKMSTISMVLSVAPALSLVFGGFLAQNFGWKGAMVLLSISGILMFASAYFLLTETNKQLIERINIRSVFSAYAAVLRNKLFVCWTMAGGMQIGIFFSLNGFLAYQFERNGYSPAEFGLWFALTPISYLFGNSFNRAWFVSRGIELAATVGCMLSSVAVISMFITQAMGITHALALALPCCLFGFGNGIVVANTTVGAMTIAGKHTGTASGIIGAWQMATGGIAGAIIVALGGTEVFSIASGALILMSLISVSSMIFVYRQRSITN